MRGFLLQLLLVPIVAAPLHAQGLRDQVQQLFQFGDCGEPLCLNVGGQHGDHYIGASRQQSGQMIAFLANALASSVSSVPIGGASGGSTFSFEGGLPVRTTVSAGPIFAERAETIGRGRLLVGANATMYDFSSLRGTPLDGLSFNFTHQNVGSSVYGDPEFENDIIQVTTDLEVRTAITTLSVAYGLMDRVDVGVALPLVRTSVSGTSTAQIIPFGTTPHAFDPSGNQLSADASVDESATGIGDVLLRAKAMVAQGTNVGFAVLGDVRLPTGSEDDLLGSGSTSVRGLGIVSGRFGDFSPHFNGGYIVRGGESERSAVLATVGFDQLVAPWATAAIDLISSWEVGDETLELPEPQQFDFPYDRTLALTNIRDRSDNVVYASLGAKLSSGPNFTVVVNGLLPVLRGGFQPNAAWTIGLEYNR